MTLVELLVAIIIVVLLAAVVFSTFRAVSVVTGGQRQRAVETHSSAVAVEQLRDDLQRAFIPRDDPDCGVILTQVAASAEIAFCMMEPSATDPDLRWANLMRVRYGVQNGRLARVSIPAAGAGSQDGYRTNFIAEGVTKFNVALYDGFDWLTVWPTDNTNSRPRGARIEIGTKDQKSWTTEVWIPAGTVFTSSFTRAAAP